ncbi:MAG: PAS domain-containing protein [Alphaproteobacteria bacterium]|nr:PAS domain-containing protein [Alphaproteobacteria bacterium]
MTEATKAETFDFPAVPDRADLTLTSLAEAKLPPELVLWAAIWSGLRESPGAIPTRSSVSMKALGSTARNIVIFEQMDTGDYKIRLAGTEVEAWMEHKLTGSDPLALVPPAQRKRVGAVYDNVLGKPCGFYIAEAIMLSRGKQAYVTALKLPLTNAEGKVTQFLTSYHFSEATFLDVPDHEAPAEHRKIDRIGFIDIGFGLPE